MLYMTEHQEARSKAIAWCQGDGVEPLPPTLATIQRHPRGRTLVDCSPRFNRDTQVCIPTGRQCLWIPDSMPPANDVHREAISTRILRNSITIEEVKRAVVYDPSSNELLESPLLQPDHEPVRFTRKEGRLMVKFMTNQGITLSKKELETTLYDRSPESETRVLIVHIQNMRTKMGETAMNGQRRKGIIIQTLRGMGYRMAPAPGVPRL